MSNTPRVEYVLRADRLVKTVYDIPQYDLGYTLGYKGDDGKTVEAEVVSIQIDASLDGTAIDYALDNNDYISEEDVLYYYEPEYIEDGDEDSSSLG